MPIENRQHDDPVVAAARDVVVLDQVRVRAHERNTVPRKRLGRIKACGFIVQPAIGDHVARDHRIATGRV